VEGARISKLRPDVAIFESTYGDKLHSNREIEEDRLVKLISRCTENGGKVLIPAFALGRAQEVILILKKALNKGKLKGVKIYVDGMVKDINTVYKLHPTYLKNSLSKKILKGMDPFYGENIIPVTKQEEREGILESKDPCIIVSSSGMLTGGPSQYYAEKLCMIEKNLIVLTGYQDEESPGRKLLDLLDEDKSDRILEIDGRKIPVNCSIQKVGLSAHGDKNEIKALIQAMMPRNIFLVHGDGSIIENLSKELSREVKVPIYVPESGETIDIDIKNPRKQFEKNIKFKMYRKDEINEKNITELWEFVLNNYGSKFFTGEDLLLIWRGDTSGDVDSLRKILINSIYFEPDRKRLFLYKAKEKNLVEEELKPKELKQNEVNEIVKDFFEEYGYQKAGLMVSEKKVILYFDFPEAVDNSIYDKIEEFKNVTSWDVTVYGQSNINAAEQLIRQLLPEAPIKKISYYAHEKKFLVTVEENIEIKDEPQRFKEATGLELEVSGTNSKKRTAGFTIKTDSNNKMEQNMALKYIEDYFKDMEHKPYKKSIKSGQDGHYIELAFISPTIGNRYIDVIKKVSNIIGWDISISSSTNQNEVINIASALCKSSGVDIYKNPSFNPADLSVTVKVTKGEVEKLDEIKDSFERLTGCTLLLKKV